MVRPCRFCRPAVPFRFILAPFLLGPDEIVAVAASHIGKLLDNDPSRTDVTLLFDYPALLSRRAEHSF